MQPFKGAETHAAAAKAAGGGHLVRNNRPDLKANLFTGKGNGDRDERRETTARRHSEGDQAPKTRPKQDPTLGARKGAEQYRQSARPTLSILAGLERLKERMSGDDMMLHAPKCDRSSVALTLPSLDVGGSGDTLTIISSAKATMRTSY